MRQVRQYGQSINDPEVEAYIQSVGYKLVANSDNNQIPFTFFVNNNLQINAFAAPGGIVGINSGVIINSDDESELASVMAHEISHVTQRHLARTYEATNKLSLPYMAAAIGAIALGIVNPQIGSAALATLSGAGAQYQINFTRSNEEEADRIGMQLLARSGFDPYGMPHFFEKLQQMSRYNRGNPPEFLLTHPLTTSRIADSEARAEQYPQHKYKSSETFWLIRAKIRANSFDSTRDAVEFFVNQLRNGGYPDIDSARYGYAIALTNNGDFAEAENQLSQLLDEKPENISFLLAAGNLAATQRKYNDALVIYRHASELYPDYWPLVMAESRALLDAQQPLAARDLLRQYGQDHDHTVQYYDLVSQAEAQTGSPGESAIAKAEYYYMTGGTKLALDHLKFALHQTELTEYQRERVKARQKELEDELALEKEFKLAPG